MIFQSLAEFVKSNNFKEIHKAVRENANGYPYLTFITKDNKAENVYFSKSKSAEVAVGMVVTGAFMRDLQIATVINAKGESRTKLVGFGESNRLDLDDLLG
jgi:hypothetical protein